MHFLHSFFICFFEVIKIKNSIISLIGNTPLIRLHEYEKNYGINANLHVKLEYLNPFGSIKDRAALQIISDAEEIGVLKHGNEIIEASSGNMGIALSAISNIRGYKCTIVMPENVSQRKIGLIKRYCANVVLTKGGMAESIKIAKEIASKEKSVFYCDQFNNISSVNAHLYSTAQEIYSQIDRVDAIICGIGSGGTATGLYRYYKNTNTQVYGVLPLDNNYIEGIGAGFIPSILEVKIMDNIIQVSRDDATKSCLEILKSEGILIGISSGAVLSACKILCQGTDRYRNKNIVLIFADGGERYI